MAATRNRAREGRRAERSRVQSLGAQQPNKGIAYGKPVFALLVARADRGLSQQLIFIIYFHRRDNVSLLRALKAISEFVVDRLLAQFINLFSCHRQFCNSCSLSVSVNASRQCAFHHFISHME